MKVVINDCYGGFGLSDAAYEKLIEWGVPVRRYIKQKRDPDTMKYLPEPNNEGQVIFDSDLVAPSEQSKLELSMRKLCGRYSDYWLDDMRNHDLLVRVVEELGDKASGKFAELKVVEIPDDVEWQIEQYDGCEHVAEKHRIWR